MQAEPPIRKRTRLQRWMRVLIIVAVLAVGADLLLAYLVDVDRYSTLISSAIERETRRKVTIGKMSARLLPRVGFVVHNFHLGNPQGFAEGDVLTVQSIRGNLALGALLRRELSLSSIELVKPRLVLLEDEHGRTNYGAPVAKTRDWPRVPGGAEAGSGASNFRFDAVESIALSKAEVVLGRVAGHGAHVAPSVEMKNLNVELKNVTLEPIQPKLWQGAANLSGVEIALPGWKKPVEVRSGKMTLRNGRLDAEFRAAMGSAADCKGTLHLADIEHGIPVFELTTAQLDMDRLLALESAETPGAAGTPRTPAGRATHAGRSELAAQGKIAAEHLRWAALTGNNLSAEVRVFSDRLELAPVKLDLYGGTLQVSTRADRGTSAARFSSNIQVRNLDLGKLLAALDAHGKMSGTGELELQLSGPLSPDWQRSLSGSGHFAVRDGRLPGVNLSGALQSVAQITGASRDTPFTRIAGDLTIAQGRVASKLIHVDSSRGKADLRGSTSLNGALDYEGQAVVVPGSAGGDAAASPRNAIAGLLGEVLQRNVSSMTVPFAIRGTIHNPRFEPGRALPSYTPPTKTSPTQPGQPPPQKKSILDLFKRP